MVGLLVKLALRPNLTLLLACRGSLSSWLPLRVRLRRRRRCSLVLSSYSFLRSRETRVTYGFKAGFASKPYSRVAEGSVFCFLLVVAVVVVVVRSCLLVLVPAIER